MARERVSIAVACAEQIDHFKLFVVSQLKNNFEIDPEAAEKIVIRRDHFYHALEYDIKPVSKKSVLLLPRGRV